MAKWMATGQSDELFERFALSRFAEGRLEAEHAEDPGADEITEVFTPVVRDAAPDPQLGLF